MSQLVHRTAGAIAVMRSGLTLAALTAALAMVGTPVSAQAPTQKKGAPAAAQPAPASAAAQQAQSAWVKLCEKATFTAKNKDGKEEKQDRNICLTHHERLDRDTGMVMVSAAIRKIDGADKEHMMVMVPLGMNIAAGIRAVIYPKELWEKAQKKEKIDDSQLKPQKLVYTICHPAGCTAEMEASPELIKDMRTAGGMMVFAVNAGGQIIAFPVPATGFGATYDGAAIDSEKYSAARRQLMEQIRTRQQELMEQYKKEQEEKGGATAGAQTPPPAAQAQKGAPPAKK